MTWRNPRVWIAVLAGLGVVVMAVADLRRSAPGPVAAVHARVDKLAGGESCRKCHGGFLSNMTSSCLACHAPIATQLGDGRGVHGRLGKERGSQCALCHSEHHGTDFALVNSVSFAQAGIGDMRAFDHTMVGYEMQGRHLDAECGACHLLADVDVLREGEHRFLGLTRECTACHLDAHGGRMQLACTECHGEEDFHALEARGHASRLPLVGGHAAVACSECHAEDAAHSLAAIGEGRAAPSRTCADCHASPHTAAFVSGAGSQTTSPTTANERAAPRCADNCATCHQPEQADFAVAADTLTPSQHAYTGFRLDAPHDQAACAQCHGETPMRGAPFLARHPGRGANDCGACHEDPHADQFATSPLSAGACVACHAATHFDPPTFDVARHADTALPLSGVHADTACDRCHRVAGAGRARVFAGTTAQCDGCHADAHDGFFAPALAERTAPPHGACEHCHQPTGFAGVAPGFDHGAWTGFALAGSHAEAGCDSCHRPRAEADARGRRFGRVAETFAEGDGCQRCHRDPHAGRFDATPPKAAPTGEGCARCHDEVSFRSLSHGFDHALWTGFALDGAHGKLGCAACHPPLATGDTDGRTWAHARGSDCAACHDDPHGGQFVQQGRNDCARCHRPTHFRALTFNHNLDARFPLGDAHAEVKCSACHKPERIDDHVVARYRPLPKTCVECHGVQEETLRRRKRRGT